VIKKISSLLSILVFASCVYSQQDDNSLQYSKGDKLNLLESDTLLTRADSLSIFSMIDSLLQLPDIKETSQLLVRLGYNSNVVSAGRTLGLNQFGLSPGISYYHKSGLYADYSGYWSKEYDPDYYLSVLSAGFLFSPTKHYSFVTEYNKYVYSNSGNDVSIPYTNNIGISNFFELRPITFRLDYQFYFGEKTAHRIMPGVSLSFAKRNWHALDRILFYPTFNVLFGSEVITETIRVGLFRFASRDKTVFGVMNYSFSAPISIRVKDWSFMLSYTYNIPKSLPGEELGLTNSGYFSASISRFLRF
jgi:hypothetical protein